jgi:hypothetical protein
VPYTTYKVLHLLGIFGVLLALGAGAALGAQLDNATRRRNSLLHGLGLLLILVSGFGMLAKGNLGFPGWVMAKLVIFLLVGALPVWMRRRNAPGMMTLISLIVVFLAGLLATLRPF